jgi:hypothetical protein
LAKPESVTGACTMIRMNCARAFAIVLGGVLLVGCSNAGRCSQPLAGDGGVTSLDDVPAVLCVRGGSGAIRWNGTCGGSIVIVQGEGVDCAKYWIFNATTKALQATAAQCNVSTVFCTGSIPGFTLPSACFDGTFPSGITQLCPSNPPDGGSDAMSD